MFSSIGWQNHLREFVKLLCCLCVWLIPLNKQEHIASSPPLPNHIFVLSPFVSEVGFVLNKWRKSMQSVCWRTSSMKIALAARLISWRGFAVASLSPSFLPFGSSSCVPVKLFFMENWINDNEDNVCFFFFVLWKKFSFYKFSALPISSLFPFLYFMVSTHPHNALKYFNSFEHIWLV